MRKHFFFAFLILYIKYNFFRRLLEKNIKLKNTINFFEYVFIERENRKFIEEEFLSKKSKIITSSKFISNLLNVKLR